MIERWHAQASAPHIRWILARILRSLLPSLLISFQLLLLLLNTMDQHTIITYQKQLEAKANQLIANIKSNHQHNQPSLHLARELLQLEQKLIIINRTILDSNDKEQIINNYQQLSYPSIIDAQYQALHYQPTQQEINDKLENMIEANWTDASQSDAEEIWVVDDEIMQAMQQQSDSQQQQSQPQPQQQLKLQQLQTQFVKGGQSTHLALFGQHSNFCVSVNGYNNTLISGGGDDKLFFYHMQQAIDPAQNILNHLDPNHLIKPFHVVQHTETVNQICMSFDHQYVFSLSDKELLCTSTSTLETTPLKIEEKEQQEQILAICTHKLGNVIAVSKGYQAYIYNIKGLKHYSTFYLDAQVNIIEFTSNGKQLLAACDNKLRIINPKTQQIIKVAGQLIHNGEITCMTTQNNLALTGCIDGYICLTNINNGTIVGRTQPHTSPISCLAFAQNYFLSATSEELLFWFDSNKLKKIFQNQINGSPTALLELDDKLTYVVGTLKGSIYTYDRRNPLKELGISKAGSTIHSIWSDRNTIAAGCEDGYVKIFDRRMMK